MPVHKQPLDKLRKMAREAGFINSSDIVAKFHEIFGKRLTAPLAFERPVPPYDTFLLFRNPAGNCFAAYFSQKGEYAGQFGPRGGKYRRAKQIEEALLALRPDIRDYSKA